jgi:hypothetical protein
MIYEPKTETVKFYNAMALYFDNTITFEEFTTIVEDLRNEEN